MGGGGGLGGQRGVVVSSFHYYACVWTSHGPMCIGSYSVSGRYLTDFGGDW